MERDGQAEGRGEAQPAEKAGREGNGLDLARISPKKGARYSPNLYRWLTQRTRTHRAWTSRVYRDECGTLWIGLKDGAELIGSKLMQVLCMGAQAKSFCWCNLKGLEELEGFWTRYMTDGRCAIDETHQIAFVGEDGRWLVKGDARSCVWCGKAEQVMKRWKETVQRSAWVSAQAVEEAQKEGAAGA